MPTLAATEEVSFFYTDSGAPLSPAYSTIVIFHGYKWHSGEYSSSLRFAHILSVHCGRTTPFTPEEEVGLALAAQGVVFARFIAELPDALGLPLPSAHGEGGITLSGWSLGTLFVRLVLSALDEVDEFTRNVLRTYVQRLILWDVPSPFIGVVPPPEAYFPLADERLSPAERMSIFIPLGLRVLHPRPPSRKPTYGAPDQDRPPSVHAPELLGIMASEASVTGDTRSVWLCTLAPWWFEDAAKKAGIPLKGKMIPDSNHSAMWDNPEITIRALEECCSAVKPHKVAAHM
ncbi:hypothetical protein GGF50DRAFT_126637 [Schizophyllum commune]